MLEEKILARLDGLERVVFARLDSQQTAANTFKEGIEKVPTEVQKSVGNLQMLLEEKFARHEVKFSAFRDLLDQRFLAVDEQFGLRDIRVDQTAVATKTAVDAAMAAAGQSAAKAEVGFARQMEQMSALFQTTTSAQREQIEDQKERVTRLEAQLLGATGQRAESHTSSSFVVAIIAVVVAILSAVAAVFMRLR